MTEQRDTAGNLIPIPDSRPGCRTDGSHPDDDTPASEPTPSEDVAIPRQGKAKYAWADVLGDAHDVILNGILGEGGDGGCPYCDAEAVLERLAALWEDDGPDSILVWSDARVAVIRRELDKLRGRIKTKYVAEAVREEREASYRDMCPNCRTGSPVILNLDYTPRGRYQHGCVDCMADRARQRAREEIEK